MDEHVSPTRYGHLYKCAGTEFLVRLQDRRGSLMQGTMVDGTARMEIPYMEFVKDWKHADGVCDAKECLHESKRKLSARRRRAP